ncbi:MAG: hypothetical protein QM758_19315 [Armatimonas sp.]
MPTEKIIFTACPQGVSGGKRVLRVHLAPQLSGGTLLSQFPALREWPTTAQKLSLKVTVGGASVVIKPTLDVQALKLWQALFPPDKTPVTSFEVENLTTRFILSYPASLVGATILLAHTGLATEADKGLPNAANLGKVLFPLLPPSTVGAQRIGYDPNRAIEQVKAKYGRGAVGIPTGANPTDIARESFFLGRAFHGARNPKPTNPTGKQTLDDLDFHGIVGQLAEYPELLKKLGLVFEVTLPTGAATEVFVEPVWAAGSPAVVAVSPRTQVSAAFYPKGDARIVDGFVDLKTPGNGYAITNFDIDGALHQFVSLAESLFNTSQRKTLDTPESTGLAPLRSTGFSVLQLGRAMLLKSRLSAAQQMKGQAAPTLDAELLNRGWRVDVRDYSAGKTSPWRSLCMRIGEYSFPKAPGMAALTGISDEGSIRTAVTEQPGHPELYLHESLFNWEGWSLCAPRPTKPVPDDGPPPVEAPPLVLKTAFETTPGTLPRLRFGRLYQFRMRAVDLAGGGRTNADPGGEAQASVPVPYGRYEPVPPPVVILQKAPGAGESADRLVIRSLAPGQGAGEPSVRHLAPPRVSVDSAVTHGVLDDASGKPDVTKIGMLHTRDADFPQVFLPDVFHPTDNDRMSRAILVPDTEAQIPYLPDPLCNGGILVGDAGFGNLPFATGTNWPNDWKTFRVRLIEGPRGAKIDGREIVVSLPKAERATFRLASLLHADAYKQFALWQWIEVAKNNGQLPAARYEALKKLAQAGGHWMLTPNRTITLVHAVLQPLEAPVIGGLSVQRVLTSPTFLMPGSLTCDAKSTGQLDMRATWTDMVDDPAKPLTETLPTNTGKVSLFSLPLRFPNDEVPASGGNVEVKGSNGKSIASWEPTNKRVIFTEGILGAAGDPPMATMPDTRYHRIRCTAIASTRFREYFLPKDTVGKPTTQTSTEAIVDVPNATPPAPPEIAFIVPTFGWERTATSSKRICGLRVYLNRPWFSSGDGELLAVVCATGAPPAVLEPHVTQLGSDPLWLGTTLPRYPAPGQFTSRLPFNEPDTTSAPGTRILPKDFVTTGLAAYGIETTSPVQVAAFAVKPDLALGLWYADIEVETGNTYFPFIRLALARYQPRSVKNAHLSAIRTTDFAQLLPDRSLTVTKQGNALRVSLTGPAPTTNVFEASIERLAPEAGDLEWQTVGTALKLDGVTISGRGTVYAALVPQPAATSGKLRLAIREWEVYANGRRLVYAENWPV